ncbi:hypothetical protein [Rubrivirga litoralis]|uniref:WD40-like Beta Propeller Repeat n=1 Tax=Rubrivirga litoralis TaxID=3075598 RepID=A0ABU3BQ54_9BACT|nr:hypothetical protein [Rubrivirga sp. F394]MDT0631404.1 hypothetical protein [Rubrivirga sp. F394]
MTRPALLALAAALAGCASSAPPAAPSTAPPVAEVAGADAPPDPSAPQTWTVTGRVTTSDGEPTPGAGVLVGLRYAPDPESRGACAGTPLDLLAATLVSADANGRYRAALTDPPASDLESPAPNCLVAVVWDPQAQRFVPRALALGGRAADAADPTLAGEAGTLDLVADRAPAPPYTNVGPSRDDLDAAFARDVVPGFAGVTVDGDTLVVLLGPPGIGDPQAEEAAVQAVLAREGMERFAGRPTRVERAPVTAETLASVRDRSAVLWQLAGSSSSWLDEQAGQAVHGYATEAAVRRARAALEPLGLPGLPVRLELAGYAGWGDPGPSPVAPPRPVYGDRLPIRTDPAWGPNGRTVYGVEFLGPRDLRLVAADTTTLTVRPVAGLSAQNTGASDLAVSPGPPASATLLVGGPTGWPAHLVRVTLGPDGAAGPPTTVARDVAGLRVAASADGRYVAYERGEFAEGVLALADVETGRAWPLGLVGRTVGPLAFAPDGRTVVAGVDGIAGPDSGDPRRAGVWAVPLGADGRPGSPRRLLPYPEAPWGPYAAPVGLWWEPTPSGPDAPRLAVGAFADGTAWVETVGADGTRQPVGLAVPAAEPPSQVSVSADGRRVAAAVVVAATTRGVEGDRHARTRLYVWTRPVPGGPLAAPVVVADVPGEIDASGWLAFSPDGRWLGRDGFLHRLAP